LVLTTRAHKTHGPLNDYVHAAHRGAGGDLETGGELRRPYLLRLVTDPGDKSRAAPKLNGRTFEKLLGLFDRFAVGKELKRIVG
jgi:hypothetical protein